MSVTAGPFGTKLGSRIHLHQGIVLGKSRLRSKSERRRRQERHKRGECRRRENGGAVGADSLRPEHG